MLWNRLSFASMDDHRLRRCATSASPPSGATLSSSSIRTRSSGKLCAARQLLTILRARRRSLRELEGSISAAPAALTCVREYSGSVHAIEPVAEPDRTSAARDSSTLARSSASGMSHRLLRACRFRPAGPYPKCRTLYGAPWRRRTQGAHGGAPDEHHPGAREVLDGRFDLHEGADGFLVVVIGVLVPTDAGGSVAPALRDDEDPSLQSAVDTRLQLTQGCGKSRAET